MYLEQFQNTYRNLRGIGNAFAEFRPIEGLTLKSQANADYSEQQQTNYRPSTLGVQFTAPPRVPVANYVENNSINWLTEQSATYDRTFGGHHVQLLGAFSAQAQRQIGGNFNGTNFPNDDISTLNAATLITGSTDAQRWGLVSYVSRLNYDFADGKYLASAAIRRDGSSRFAPQNRWGVFPSASLGWRLSEESFLKNVSWLNDLKLRLAYGQTGNNDLGNYSYVGQVGISDYINNNALASGRTLNTLGNANLGWEKTEEVDGGFDLALFNNRISFTVDAYNGITKDLLLNVEIPQSSGFGTVTKNTGRVRNRGLEVAMHTLNLTRGSFQWSSDVNVAMNRNVVLALGSNSAPIRSGASGEASPTHITMVGQPVGMFYGYVFQGLYKDAADIARSGAFAGAIPGQRQVQGRQRRRDDHRDQRFRDHRQPISRRHVRHQQQREARPVGSVGAHERAAWRLADGRVLPGRAQHRRRVQRVARRRQSLAFAAAAGRRNAPDDRRRLARTRRSIADVSSLWVHDATNLNIRNVTLRYNVPERFAWAAVRERQRLLRDPERAVDLELSDESRGHQLQPAGRRAHARLRCHRVPARPHVHHRHAVRLLRI